jgi:hypothetical protein
MKRVFLLLGLSLSCSLVASAQQAETKASGAASIQTPASVSQSGINLESRTNLTGQLQNTIDARQVKVGDQVTLKTTQAIKAGERTVVAKGSRLVGHVTEVVQQSKSNGESRIGVLFDRLEQGSLQTPIAATITSVTSGRASVNAGSEDSFGSDTMAGGSLRSSSSARSSSSSSGGLLGGVGGTVNSTTSTVGSVVGGATSAVGSTVDSTTRAVGGTANGASRSLSGIQISQSSSTSLEGSSVLSLQGGNLRLEKGTNFNLVLTQSVHAGTSKEQ